MAYHLRRSDDEGVPHNAIKSPDDDFYLAVCDEVASNAFGIAVQDDDGDVKGWFPYGGDEMYKKGDDFSFMTKNPSYSYSWIVIGKYLKDPEDYHPLEVDGICPASFGGRIGKVNLQSLEGWTGFGGEEKTRSEEEVKEAKVLCARRKYEECHIKFQQSRAGVFPPAKAVRAHHCQFKSFVILSTDFDEPTFGRASLTKHQDGLQAWFPYGGEEVEQESFLLLKSTSRARLYWAPIRQVVEDPDRHEIVKEGRQSPAVMRGILGKAIIEDVQGWISYDSEEVGLDGDDVLNGTVLCYGDHDCLEYHRREYRY